ncbi:hypothetical protein D9V86_06875, partial [Bacteroidetes/Chlorobi group bacterium ChocPot_Mid]
MRSLITIKLLFSIATFLVCIVTTSAQTDNVGIGTTTPNNSAILELLSTTKGLLIPRLTSVERDAIASPATSLIIYNTTTNQFEFNKGTPASPNWIGIASTLNLANVYGSGADGQVTYWNSSSTITGSNDLFWSYATKKLGIGNNTPRERLDLVDGGSVGALIVGNAENTNAGTIRWSGTDFEGYDGSQWLSFTASSTIDGSGTLGQVTFWSGPGLLSGSNNLYWDATNSILGVGTNSPSSTVTIDVLGNARIQGNLEVTGEIDPLSITLQPQNSSPTAVKGKVYYNNTDNKLNVYDGNSWKDIDSWSESGGNVYRTSGRVGIGTNTPQERLDLQDISGNGAIVVGNSSASISGIIKFDGFDYYGYIDPNWVSLTTGGGGGGSSTITGAGATGQVTIWSGPSSLTGSNNLFWNNVASKLGIGDDTPDHVLDVAGNIGLDAGSYINFDDVDGFTGYGFRDNAGVIQFKNSGGSWQNFSSLSGGDVYGGGTGSAGQVAFWNSSSTITGVSRLFWDNNNNVLRIGSNGYSGGLQLFSEQGGTDYNVMFIPNSAMTESTTYTLPPNYGSSGQVLTTDGNGALNWTSVSGGGGGGNVYGNGSNGQIAFWNSSSTITGVNNLFWNNSQSRLEIVGTIQAGKNGTSGAISLFSEQGGTDYNVMFIPNSSMTESTTYTLPADYGSSGQVLTTDGNGLLNWTTVSGGGGGGNVYGNGSNGQIAFWNSSSTITGVNNLFWNNSQSRLEIVGTI